MISVLYVDDEPAVLDITRTFLERGGDFRVDTASSAQDAIVKLKNETYDAVVADYLMPDMDGIALLRYLRPRCNGMPFILFTGRGSEEIAIAALNAGADYYLKKEGAPATQMAELTTKIRAAVARWQSERALKGSEKTYRELVENLSDIVCSLNGEGRVTYISPHVSRFGYEPKEVIGRDFSLLVAAEDIPAAGLHLGEAQQGRARSFDLTIRDKGGSSRRVHVLLRPQMEEGRLHAIQGLLTEVPDNPAGRAPQGEDSDAFFGLFDLVPDGLVLLDSVTGAPARANEAAARQLGYTREEFGQIYPQDYEAPDAPHRLREKIPEILSKGRSVFLTRHRTRDGRFRDVTVTAHLLEHGGRKWIGAVFHDSTDEKLAQGILTEQLGQLKGIYEHAPVACLMLIPDGRIAMANNAAAQLLGCGKDEAAGRALAGFFAPADQMRLSAALLRLVHAGNIHEGHLALADSDNQARIVSLDGAAVTDQKGITSGLLLALCDVTGHARREEILQKDAAASRSIVEGARDGILACDNNLAITGWNPAMEDITGIPAKEALGRTLAGLLPFIGGTGPDSLPARALAGEISATPDLLYEYPAAKKRGWARAVFSPLRDPAGAVYGAVGVVQEITARTGAAQRIRTSNRLYAVSAAVNETSVTSRELMGLLDETCRTAAREAPVVRAWIGLLDPALGILRPVTSTGRGEELPKEGYRVAEAGGKGWPAGMAIKTGTPVACPDTRDDHAAVPWKAEALRQGYRSLAAIPFRLRGETVGVLCLCSDEPEAFLDTDAARMALLGNALSSALDMLDRKTLQRRAGKGSHGSWERTRLFAYSVESAPVPFAVIFPDGKTSATNAAFSSLLGYTEDELLDLSIQDLVTGRSPADDFLPVARVLSTKRPERYEGCLRKKDGSLIFVEIFLQATTDETSGQTCASLFVINATEQTGKFGLLEKELARYRTIFMTGSAATLVVTPGGAVRAANPLACALFGTGNNAPDSINGCGSTGSGDPRFVELARTCAAAGTAKGMLRLVKKDGTPFDAVARATEFTGPDNEPLLNLVLDLPEDTSSRSARNCEIARAVLDTIPVPVRREETAGSSFCNRAWLAFTGRTAAQEQGNGWLEGVHPDDRQRCQDAKSGADFRLRCSTGEYRQVHEIRLPDEGTGEDEAGLTCFCFDVTPQKSAEDARERLAAYSRILFENCPDALCLVGNGVITDCNTAAVRLFAGTRDDLLGHTPGEFASPKTNKKEAQDRVMEYRLGQAVTTGTQQQFAWACTVKDGTTRETIATVVPIEERAGGQTLVCIRDMTAQGRAERERAWFASYPELDPDPVIDTGRDRGITYANPAARHVLLSLGLPPDFSVFLPADFDTLAKIPGSDHAGTTERIVQIKERSFLERLCPLLEENQFRIYAYDITDRIHATEALAYSNHKLGILTSITRHDIQNKLTGVLGYLDLIRGLERDPQLAAYIDKAEASAHAIRHHIDFTKDYESLGGTAPVWQEIAPIMADVRSHFDTTLIAFTEPGQGFAVFADPMFAKVLYNLVDNSLRHGVQVKRISFRYKPLGEGCLLIYEDDGIGIPEDKKETIFERGFTTSTGPAKSTGLGLFLVREILAITGITIRETGVPGRGSLFEMHIPPGRWRTSSGQ